MKYYPKNRLYVHEGFSSHYDTFKGNLRILQEDGSLRNIEGKHRNSEVNESIHRPITDKEYAELYKDVDVNSKIQELEQQLAELKEIQKSKPKYFVFPVGYTLEGCTNPLVRSVDNSPCKELLFDSDKYELETEVDGGETIIRFRIK
jgi:hypothetical protein